MEKAATIAGESASSTNDQALPGWVGIGYSIKAPNKKSLTFTVGILDGSWRRYQEQGSATTDSTHEISA